MRSNNGTQIDAESIARQLQAVFSEEAVDQLARKTLFLRRKRKLIPYALVACLVATLGCMEVNWIADILRAYNKLTGKKFDYSPFHKRLEKPAFADWMREMFEVVITRLSLQVLEPMPKSKLSMFDDIIMHDGTSFAIKASLKNVFPGRFTKTSPAAVELHVTMSGFRNALEYVTLAPDKESEKHFRPEAASFKNCLILEDRSFQDRSYFQEIDEEEGYFIIRGTKNIRPIIRKAYDAIGNRINHLEGKKLSHKILPKYAVDLEVEWGNYKGRIVVIYKRGKRNKKDYTYLHTNLNKNMFSIEEVGILYRLRWQIELLFLEWKSHANLHRFDTTKEPIVEGFIWASIMAAAVKRFITFGAELSTKTELSTRRAAASAALYFSDIIKALVSSSFENLVKSIKEAFEFLRYNATRAHPQRDREKGRLKSGLRPVATG